MDTIENLDDVKNCSEGNIFWNALNKFFYPCVKFFFRC